jgi:hypothetical protein
MKATKIKNSLKKGRLWVLCRGREWEVIELFTKKVLIRNREGDMLQVSVHEVEFKDFIKQRQTKKK